MGPLPQNIGKINSWPPLLRCWQYVLCTSCTECEVVQVVCTTETLYQYIERMGIYAWRNIWCSLLGVSSVQLLTY